MIARSVLLAALLTTAAPALAQPMNDSCESAEALSGYTLIKFDAFMATQDGPSPAGDICTFSPFNEDVWYCWTAQETDEVQVRLCNTTYDTVLAVYEGCGCPSGPIVACNDDSACGTQSIATFNAVAGQSYTIRIGSYYLDTASYGTLEIRSTSPAPIYGPVVNPANNHQYYLLQSSSWTAAQAAAVRMGGNLATVRSIEENEFLRAEVLGYDGADRRGWIGLNDIKSEGNFVWVSGEPVVFTNWSGGEPNNNPPPENWVEMFGSNGAWNDNANQPSFAVYGLVEIVGSSCEPDFNNDGALNSQDFFDFLNAFFANQPNADYNGDSVVNSQDFFDFLNAFFAGCE